MVILARSSFCLLLNGHVTLIKSIWKTHVTLIKSFWETRDMYYLYLVVYSFELVHIGTYEARQEHPRLLDKDSAGLIGTRYYTK